MDAIMNAAAVARVIEGKPRLLIDQLNVELKRNLGTSHYHRLSEEQLSQRHSHIFDGLAAWLTTKENATLQKNGEDLGNRRFREGTPLGQVVLVLILVEKHLGTFLDASAPVEPDVRNAVTEFFQKFAYYTAKGYEAALAVSNRMASRPAMQAGAEPPRKEAAKSVEKDMEISRGGQVGEVRG